MGRATKAVEIIVLILLAGAGSLVAVGAATASGHTPGDPHGWYVGAACVFGAAVFLTLCYFAIHPAIAALDSKRIEWLNSARSSRPQPVGRRPKAPKAPKAAKTPKGQGPAAAGGSTLVITGARYGTNDTKLDATERVRAAINGGRLQLTVSNDNMGGDPAVDQTKFLVVDYVLDGTAHTTRFPEGAVASLP